MAASGSFARGDQPRSVPDPDAAAHEEAMRRQRAYNLRQAGEAEEIGAPIGVETSPGRETDGGYWAKHPGLAESLVPVWGSAREAIADAHDGDWGGAVINGGLAAADLIPGTFAAKGIAKGGLKMAGSHTWNATRKWMGRRDMLEPFQHGHHGIIPNGGWGKRVPDAIKNQPPNITAMPSPEVHGRIHGRYKGQARYGELERYWRGTPGWARWAHLWAPNGAVTATDAARER